MDFISYCRGLKPEDWRKKVNEKWTVKDVVAHMVGWEKEVARVLLEAWRTGQKPWFIEAENYDEFNSKSVEGYTGYSPEDLLLEWESFQNRLNDLITEIGEENLRKLSGFDWVFDGGEDGHYAHHLRQIKEVVESK